MSYVRGFVAVEPNENILSPISARKKSPVTDNGNNMDLSSGNEIDANGQSDYNCNKQNFEGENLAPPAANASCENGKHRTASPNCQSSVSSFMQESGEFQWCLDYGCERDFMKGFDSHPTSIFSFDENQASYDDLSKNIDANLAEIDMETFRSEDINSILSLPALYGESFTSIAEDLPNTLDSYSSGGKIETNSHSTSEESSEISIYKTEPLFSPVKEPETKLGTMSTDSLDYSTLGKHDISLTCQALKNNYTIAFEGSGTQLSDGSSGSGKVCNLEMFGRGSMIQSDIGFTTWSKVQNVMKKKMNSIQPCAPNTKSFSMPSLSAEEMAYSMNEKFHSRDSVLIYDVHSSQSMSSQDSSTDNPRSPSLLKLYMQHKNAGSLTSSDSVSESSTSSPRKNNMKIPYSSDKLVKNKNVQQAFISNLDPDHTKSHDSIDFPENLRPIVAEKNCNSAQLIMKTSLENAENNNNNNNICIVSQNNNTRVTKPMNDNEEENSLYFEDSLIEAAPPKTKLAYASPIKEEEEPFEFSSGEETMRESKDVFLSGSERFESEGLKKKPFSLQTTQLIDSKNVKANSFSPGDKLVNFKALSNLKQKTSDLISENHSQSTQTKFAFQRNQEDLFHSPLYVAKTAHLKCDAASQVRAEGRGSPVPSFDCNVGKKDHPLLFSKPEPPTVPKKCNVMIMKTCHNSTQVPVHIKDKAIQTSLTDDGIFTPVKPEPNDQASPSHSMRCATRRDSPTKPFYIYYPNYSLPDLSFLRSYQNIGETADHPHLHRKVSCGEKTLIKRRARSSEGRYRPTSYNCENLCPVNPIKDWASLSILLPEKVKGIIRPLKEQEILIDPQNDSHKDGCLRCTDNPPPLPKRSLSLCQKFEDIQLQPRSILRKSVNCTVRQSHSAEYRNVAQHNPKRWSLQEPPFKCNFSAAGHNSCLNSPDDPTKQRLSQEMHVSKSSKVPVDHALVAQPNVCGRASPLCHVGEEHAPRLQMQSSPCTSYHQSNCVNVPSDDKCRNHYHMHSDSYDYGVNMAKKVEQSKATDSKTDFESDLHCECPPQEFIVSPSHCSPSSETTDMPVTEIEKTIWMRLVNTKSAYLEGLEKSVSDIIASAHHKKYQLQESMTEDNSVATFCQILYRIFSDGLQSSVPELPGSVSESVWYVIQASVLQDCHAKSLQRLIEDVTGQPFVEDTLRFHGYVLALLNMGWLDLWMAHFIRNVKTIRQYYRPTSLFYLLTFPLATTLQNQVLETVKPLKDVSFNLEVGSVFQLNPYLSDENESSKEEEEIKEQTVLHHNVGKAWDKTPPNETVIWSGTTVYPFCQGHKEELDKMPYTTHVKETHETVVHNHSAPNRKTKTLKDTSSNERISNNVSVDSGCSSGIHPGNKEEFPRFQQLRQRWEKLTCVEDTATAASKPTRTLPSKPDVPEADIQRRPKPVVILRSPAKTVSKNLSENSVATPQTERRRSLIPIHKGNKGITNRRSGSAPSERGQR